MVSTTKNEIIRLRKMRKWKNNVEIKRIDIAIEQINWKGYKEIKKNLNCWESNISYVKKAYARDKNTFYKTNYRWAKETYKENYTNKILKFIKEKIINNKWSSIRDIVEFLWLERNKKSYNSVRYITRRRLQLNYQKPYIKDKKSPDNAEDILKKKHRWKYVLR